MARSRREQKEELEQAMQSNPEEQSRSTQPPEQAVGARPASAGESVRSFSDDPSPFSRPALSPDSSAYRELVSIAAYYRAERRGFAPGGEVEDWLVAEQEVAARLHEARPA
jgi:hypothetical protein